MNIWSAILLVLVALSLFQIMGCCHPDKSNQKPVCVTYLSYGIKPSRTIMEQTGRQVAPAWVSQINNDGTLVLECFPGPGRCPRVCRDDVPAFTINPFTTEQVDHSTLMPGDTIWWPYYEPFF